ncbi:MAG: CHASE2 domain-containing protein [Myxococcales bacterium]|nr:CHASE2 domain-containing protein [Myxococcales bacterium]
MSASLSPRAKKLVAAGLVGVLVGLVAAVLAFARPRLLEGGELWTYDQRARAAARPSTASPDIVLIEVSEQDIEDAEDNLDVTWPWPRAMYGYIAAYCKTAGAKVVVFDWLFQDRGQYSVGDAEEFAQAMRDAGNVVIGLALTKDPLVARSRTGAWAAPLRRFDDAAAAEIAAQKLLAWNTRVFLVPDGGGVTVWYGGKDEAADVVAAWRRMSAAEELAELFAPPEPADDAPTGDAPTGDAPTGDAPTDDAPTGDAPTGDAPTDEAPADDDGEPAAPIEPAPRVLTAAELATELTPTTIITRRDGFVGGDGGLTLERRDGLDPPLAVIAAGPARAGNVYQGTDADGIMRQHMPLVRHDGRLYPSLALAAYLVAHPEVTPRLVDGELVLGSRRIALDEHGRFSLRFHGAGVYPRIPAYELLRSQAQLDEGAAPAIAFERLRGKYVIVAATGQALRDIRITPLGTPVPGSEIQATALDNLEAGRVIVRQSRPADAAMALGLCALVAMLVTGVWMATRRTLIALAATTAITAGSLLAYWWLARWLFTSRGVWIAVATPALGAIASVFAIILVTSAAERRNRRFVQEALGRYTSPALVKELIEHPEHLSLEWGERRGMSVYFSDIAGFTSFSENLSPEDLVALLNDYLTHMTDLVLEHGGVVDKYIGDAVMAFWGAPIPNQDHAAAAIRCAIAMRDRCAELRPGWRAKFGVDLFARAGLSSGDAVVGNMGSRHKYNYTVMGDMVNLASRLEGANKPYGTSLMISEACYARVKDLVVTRELDFLAVKGKEQPVRVYEVFAEVGQVGADVIALTEAFGAALARYRARDFAGAQAAFEAILVNTPDDGPSKTYVERCRQLAAEPPSDDWDGVWHLKEK